MSGRRATRVLGEGALMDSNRRLEDVYMFMLQVSRSHSPLTGSGQNAFIRAPRGSPWEHAVCQRRETPHCQGHSPQWKAQEESNSHTSTASPTGLVSGQTPKAQLCPKREKLSQVCPTVCLNENLMVWSRGKRTVGVCAFSYSHTWLRKNLHGVICSASGVNWALYPYFFHQSS